MVRARVENKETRLEISSSLKTSPLALTIFLDALAELIAEAILEEAAQGAHVDAQNALPALAPTKEQSC